MTEYGRFTDAHELLDLLARRKADLGLSNVTFDKLCWFTDGQADKYIGPSRVKSPSLANLEMMLDALGLSGTLYVDETKAESLAQALKREGTRYEPSVRPSTRISKALARRAGPVWASLVVHARWKKTTPEQRKAVSRELHQAKARKKRIAYGTQK